jgi:hypothetical protein
MKKMKSETKSPAANVFHFQLQRIQIYKTYYNFIHKALQNLTGQQNNLRCAPVGTQTQQPGEQAQWSHDQWTNLTPSWVENELGKKYDKLSLYYEQEVEIKSYDDDDDDIIIQN